VAKLVGTAKIEITVTARNRRMPLNITQIDAFTDRPFAGNPAAVCLLPEAREASWMQAVAREMNLAKRPFLCGNLTASSCAGHSRRRSGSCGHATLASAHALWEEGHLRPDEQARFDTRSGGLPPIVKGIG